MQYDSHAPAAPGDVLPPLDGYTRSADVAALPLPVLFLEVHGLEASADSEAFYRERDAWLAAQLARETFEAVSADPRLAGYRELHAAVGHGARRNRASPESLFHRLHARGGLPRINALVDLYSLVSMQTRVSFGAHDLERLTPPVRLVTVRGGEPFTALGSRGEVALRAGEYAYLDATECVIGRMDVRQAAHTALADGTRNVLFIVQGHAALDAPQLEAAAAALLAALRQYGYRYVRAASSTLA